MSEKPKRLKPKGDTVRQLFLKSGNLCAFPGCGILMMTAAGAFVGEVCHIEAAETGGERFNPAMTNEERRSFTNLVLMCHQHHVETNDVKRYPVEKLANIKHDHERRFSHPDRAILHELKDWTRADQPTEVSNLHRINAELGWGYSDLELSECISELNAYIGNLQKVPIEVRQFVGAVSKRMVRVSNTRAVHDGISGTTILLSDVKASLRLGNTTIDERLNQLDAYELGGFDEVDGDLGPQPAIKIGSLASGWPLWLDLVAFCNATDTSLRDFTDNLDFSILDM